MAAVKKGAGGFGQKVGRVLLYFLAAGFLLALLRAFDYDPFGLLGWLWDWITHGLNYVSDKFSGNHTFQKVTQKPTIIIPFW